MTFLTKDYFAFFAELENNNNKEWFDVHRKDYENNVKKPFRNLVEHIIGELMKIDDTITTDVSKCIFRINKDVRFSKDKSPYKLNQAAVFGANGKKTEGPSFYLHIGHKEIFIGGGMYMISKEDLNDIRQEIYYNPKNLEKVLEDKSFKKYYGQINGDRNKILPEPFRGVMDSQPYIANKQFYTGATLTQSDVLSSNFSKQVIEYFKAVKPLNDFLSIIYE